MRALFQSLDISASGLTAERMRMDVVSANLASENAISVSGSAYKRHLAVLSPLSNGGVAVSAILVDNRPGPRTYNPGSPLANAQGYVQQSNVNPVEAMVNLLDVTRAYEANVTAFNAGKQLDTQAIGVLT